MNGHIRTILSSVPVVNSTTWKELICWKTFYLNNVKPRAHFFEGKSRVKFFFLVSLFLFLKSLCQIVFIFYSEHPIIKFYKIWNQILHSPRIMLTPFLTSWLRSAVKDLFDWFCTIKFYRKYRSVVVAYLQKLAKPNNLYVIHIAI